jgi:hypothetical protein
MSFKPFVLVPSAPTSVLQVPMTELARKLLRQPLEAIVENPISQKWRFGLKTFLTQAAIMKTLLIDSPQNIEIIKNIEKRSSRRLRSMNRSGSEHHSQRDWFRQHHQNSECRLIKV